MYKMYKIEISSKVPALPVMKAPITPYSNMIMEVSPQQVIIIQCAGEIVKSADHPQAVEHH